MPFRPPLLLTLVATAFVTACSSDECEDRRDCPAGQECVGGACQVILRPGGGSPGTPPDAGPGPSADAGPRPDAMAPSDGGRSTDAGTADSGPSDARTADAGFANAGPASRGEVWIGELGDSGGSSFTAFARIVDESGATFTETMDTIQDLEGGTCRLTVRRQQGGAITGYRAAGIIVRPDADTDSTFRLLPRGSGLFTPDTPPPARLFSGSTETEIEFEPSSASDSLLSQVTTLSSPPEFSAIAPLPGTLVSIVSLPTFRWVGATPPRTVIVEVYDELRQVILTCPTADDGTYTLAPLAASAFLNSMPQAPLTLELRRDVEVVEPVFARSGVQFDVTFRVSWGARYEAQ